MTAHRDDDDCWAEELGRTLRAPSYSRPAARAAILAAVAAERAHATPWRRFRQWALTPWTVRFSPAAGAAALLLLATGTIMLRRDTAGTSAPTTRVADARVMQASAPATLTHFALLAPDAKSVSLVGDFNDWDPRATPLRRVEGAWEVDLPITAGRHTYAFIVDGADWVPDPAAPMEQGSDFGQGNSLLLVRRS